MQLNAEPKSVDEDKDRVFARFCDEIKAKEVLTGEHQRYRLCVYVCVPPGVVSILLSTVIQLLPVSTFHVSTAERHFIVCVCVCARACVCVCVCVCPEGIRQMEVEQESLQAETESYTDQIQRMQQKLHIMTEMYQENELKLHRWEKQNEREGGREGTDHDRVMVMKCVCVRLTRMLTVEERGRLQKEEKLTKADRNITQAVEELTTYR